jgi:hypothetical protein
MKLKVGSALAACRMASRSKFRNLWKRVADGVVQDVPPNLDGCETCRELECTQERWESCELRLAAAKVAALADSSDDPSASATVSGTAPPEREGGGAGQPDGDDSKPKPTGS